MERLIFAAAILLVAAMAFAAMQVNRGVLAPETGFLRTGVTLSR